MSRPWNRFVYLHLAPTRVVAVLAAGFPGRKMVARIEQPVHVVIDISLEGPSNSSRDSTAAALAVAVESALKMLEQSAPLLHARMQVELDDSLVHLDVAAGDFAGQSDPQLQSIAVACVAELLSDDAAEHEIRWTLQAGDRHMVICAIPRRYLNVAQNAARNHGLRLASVQPWFSRRWNERAHTLTSDTSVFVVASEQNAVVACVVRRAICAISMGPWTDPSIVASADSAGAPVKATRGTASLDARVERLLASMGIADDADADYLLMTSDPTWVAGASRWVVYKSPVLST